MGSEVPVSIQRREISDCGPSETVLGHPEVAPLRPRRRAPKLAPMAAALLRLASMNEDAAERFLNLIVPERRDRTRAALRVLQDGERDDGIYNVALMDAKKSIDRSYEEAFKLIEYSDSTTRIPGPGNVTHTPGWLLYVEFGSQDGVRNSIATSKKLTKTKIALPVQLAAIRELVNAALPIAHLIEDLKKKVIKGRKPDPAVQARRAAVDADKLTMTCPCCFRGIAVLPSGKMADHGYTLPSNWIKTASCPGHRFRPLEVSSDGLVYMIEQSARHLKQLDDAIARAPGLSQIVRRSRIRGGKDETITRDSPEWDREHRDHVRDLEARRRATEDQLKLFEDKLGTWRSTAKGEEAVGKSRKRGAVGLNRDIQNALGRG